MKTKEEIIKELVESIVKEYDLIPNPHGAFIYESDCHNHRVSLKYLIRDCINQAYNLGFESFRVKVEEGVKNSLAGKEIIIKTPNMYDADQVVSYKKKYALKASLHEVLTTIMEIKQ